MFSKKLLFLLERRQRTFGIKHHGLLQTHIFGALWLGVQDVGIVRKVLYGAKGECPGELLSVERHVRWKRIETIRQMWHHTQPGVEI